jgi:hypothetical protein
MEGKRASPPPDVSANGEAWTEMVSRMHDGVMDIARNPTIKTFGHLALLLREAILMQNIEPEDVAHESAYSSATEKSRREQIIQELGAEAGDQHES